MYAAGAEKEREEKFASPDRKWGGETGRERQRRQRPRADQQIDVRASQHHRVAAASPFESFVSLIFRLPRSHDIGALQELHAHHRQARARKTPAPVESPCRSTDDLLLGSCIQMGSCHSGFGRSSETG